MPLALYKSTLNFSVELAGRDSDNSVEMLTKCLQVMEALHDQMIICTYTQCPAERVSMGLGMD